MTEDDVRVEQISIDEMGQAESGMVSPPPKGWNLGEIPPAGHPDVGEFFYKLFQNSVAWREYQLMPDRWMEGYRLFRGALWNSGRSRANRHKNVVNLLIANIQRTVANITARRPTAEVVSMDGSDDQADVLMTNWTKKWYSDTEQGASLTTSAQNMETFGSTIEKAVWDAKRKTPDVVVCDLFSTFPAPGVFANIDDMPYFCHAYAMPVDEIERIFEVEDVGEEDNYSLLGGEREDYRPTPAIAGSGNLPINFTSHGRSASEGLNGRPREALVIEVWVRDYSTELVPAKVDEHGNPAVDENGEPIMVEQPVYPGGIRLVTIAREGKFVLVDRYNPNVNPAVLEMGSAEETYLYDHFPFSKADSFEDSSMFWGYAVHEQVGDILKRINELIARIDAYCKLALLPPLIVPKDTGIKLSQITNKPGLILQPATWTAGQGIRYLQIPNPPRVLFEQLSNYLQFFDRICQIEDAARGKAPNGVTAAAGIMALQERGEVMIQAKIRAIDYLVRMRGRFAISMLQNFGVDKELVELDDQPQEIIGVMLAGRKFQYVVESGSTVARTSVQIREQAVELYKMGVIDRRALLEALNFPGWKGVLERVGEGQLDQALQILIDAGLSEETAVQLKQLLLQPQTRKPNPGEEKSAAVPPSVKPAADKAVQQVQGAQ